MQNNYYYIVWLAVSNIIITCIKLEHFLILSDVYWKFGQQCLSTAKTVYRQYKVYTMQYASIVNSFDLSN